VLLTIDHYNLLNLFIWHHFLLVHWPALLWSAHVMWWEVWDYTCKPLMLFKSDSRFGIASSIGVMSL